MKSERNCKKIRKVKQEMEKKRKMKQEKRNGKEK